MSIYSKLYNWQKNIVNKYKDRQSFGLYLDMGTGKTPVSLSFAEANNCDKILIITINSKATEEKDVKGSWLNWASQMDYNYCFKTKKDIEFTDNPEILIVNYESLYKRGLEKKKKIDIKDNINSFIKACKNHNACIIIDESHKLKDSGSLQTKAVNEIYKKICLIANKTKLYLLSGTPFTTGYIDLYSQLNLLGCPINKTQFIDRYCIKGHLKSLTEWQQPIVGYKNIDELYNLIHQYAITIKSDEVSNLPEQIFIDHITQETEEFRALTREKLSGNDIVKYIKNHDLNLNINDFLTKSRINNPFYRNLAYPEDKWVAETTGSYWMRCRQASIGFQGNSEECQWFNRDRLNQLKQFLKDNVDNYIIFYNYVPELIEIYDICEELGYNIDVYCGDVKNLTFYDKYSLMSESDKLTHKNNIIISNFASGSTGKNWQNYNKCIIFSLPLYKDYAQGIKRIHRTGQKQPVYYHIFYQNNDLDLDMDRALKEGIDYTEKMFEKKSKSF